MKKITQEELKKILENHMHWLKEDVSGWEQMRADLSEADLRGIYLEGADLRGVDLRGAYLGGAYLGGAYLIGAYLGGADLRVANLRRADLREVDLREADLAGADLREADLRGAYLGEADLRGSDLRGVDLKGADLKEVCLREADLTGAKNVPFIPTVCPDEGSFTAYKKASGKIVVLRIPHDARRLSATGRICRCNKAEVLRVENIDGSDSGLDEVKSDFDSRFLYRVGKTVKVDDFDEDRWNECSKGIHFFINRQEAVEY